MVRKIARKKSSLAPRRTTGAPGRPIKVRTGSQYPVANVAADDGPEEVMVESIQGIRISEGSVQYWVHWANYDEKDNTWEPLEHLTNCHDQLQAWHNMILRYQPPRSQDKALKSVAPLPNSGDASHNGERKVDAQVRESASSSISLLGGRKQHKRLPQGRAGIMATKMVVAPALNITDMSEDEPPADSQGNGPVPEVNEVANVQESDRRNPPRVRAKPTVASKTGNNSGEPGPSGIGRKGGRRSLPSNSKKIEDNTIQDSGTAGRKKSLRAASVGVHKNQPPLKKVKIATKLEKASVSKRKVASVQRGDGGEETDRSEAQAEMYVVERILGCLTDEGGNPWYLVKWMDFPLEDSSWEDAKAVKYATAEVNKFKTKYGKPTWAKPKVLSPDGRKFDAWVAGGTKGPI